MKTTVQHYLRSVSFLFCFEKPINIILNVRILELMDVPVLYAYYIYYTKSLSIFIFVLNAYTPPLKSQSQLCNMGLIQLFKF